MKIYQLAVLGVLAFCLGCSSGESGKSSSGGPSSGEEATATTDVSTGDAGTTGDVEDAKSTGKSDAKSVDMANMTPEKVLESMVAAYKNASSYTDEGQIQLLGIRGPNESKSIPLISPMSMSLEKPNKLQIIANKGTVICDGKNFYGYVDPLPTQVFQKPAPEKITIESIFTEPILADAMAQGPTQYYTWIPIQAILLLADKPLNTLLYNVERSELLKPQTFEGHPCYRVAIYRNDGKGVFWIDAETFVLRRFEYPLGNLLNDLQTDQADDLKVIADFRNAKLNGEIAERTFSFQPPKKSQIVDMLAPLQIHMLGQPAPEFFFERTDGKPPVTLKSLKGKTVVIDFWASWSMQCRSFLSVTSKVAEAFKDDDNVVFLACSTDRGTVENEELEKALKSMNVSIPLVRDTQDFSHREFFIPGVPTTVIIGPKGIVQDYQVQVDPRRYMVLSRAIQAVAQGANIYERQLSMFDELRKNYEKIFQRMLAEDLFIDPQSISQMMPLPGVARQSAPRRARLMQLWKCKDVGIPGNIVVLKDTEPQRILVCHDSHSVAELDARGKIIKNYRFAIPPIDAAITNLRPGKTADGKQFYIGFAPSFQQFFFLDEKFNVKWGFPESLSQGAPSGIADVQVGDLDDDGTPEIYVGYLGKAGVKAISLEGQVLWSNRKTSGVTKMAIIPKTPENPSRLICTTDQHSLVELDGQGQIVKPFDLGNRRFYWIAAAQLVSQEQVDLCALSAPDIGKNEAFGINLNGDLLWAYQMPDGTPGSIINRVISGHVYPMQNSQWILLAADSSIHFISESGRPVEAFNYGSFVAGIAAVTLGDQEALLISSRSGVEAISLTRQGTALCHFLNPEMRYQSLFRIEI